MKIIKLLEISIGKNRLNTGLNSNPLDMNDSKRPNSKSNKYLLLLLSRFSRCQTLCDPIDGSPPGSPILGILKARTMEWVAISFSNNKYLSETKSNKFYRANRTINKMKMQTMEWEKIFAHPISDKGLISKVWKTQQQTTHNNLLKMGSWTE